MALGGIQDVVDQLFEAMNAIIGPAGSAGTGKQLANGIHDTEAELQSFLSYAVFTIQSNPLDGYFPDGSTTLLNMTYSVDIVVARKLGAKAARIISDALYAGMGNGQTTLSGFVNLQIRCLDRGGRMTIAKETYTVRSMWKASNSLELSPP